MSPICRVPGVEMLPEGSAFQAVDQNISEFIDGTNFDLARMDGRNNMQETFYDGHKKKHAVVFQGVVAPNGILTDLSGPYPGRRHDEYMVTASQVNERMRDCQAGNLLQYKLMGDKAYTVRSHIGRPFVGNDLSPEQVGFNLSLSRLRVSVEHIFGKMKVMSAPVTWKAEMKLFASPVGRYFVNAAILANCHTCLNGSVVGQYFDCDPPSIHDYLGV